MGPTRVLREPLARLVGGSEGDRRDERSRSTLHRLMVASPTDRRGTRSSRTAHFFDSYAVRSQVRYTASTPERDPVASRPGEDTLRTEDVLRAPTTGSRRLCSAA